MRKYRKIDEFKKIWIRTQKDIVWEHLGKNFYFKNIECFFEWKCPLNFNAKNVTTEPPY